MSSTKLYLSLKILIGLELISITIREAYGFNIGEIINNGINNAVEPCDDFYSYVCGSWEMNYQKFFDSPGWFQGKFLNKELGSVMKEIFQTPSNNNDHKELEQEKKWIAACKDIDKINNKGLKHLQDIVKKIGGWPITIYPSEYIDDQMRQAVDEFYASQIGESAFFNIELDYQKGMKISNPFKRDLYQRLVALSDTDFKDEISKILTIFKLPRSAKRQQLNSYDMIEFDTFQKKLIQTVLYIRPNYELMRIGKLQETTDEWFSDKSRKISWLPILNAIFKGTQFKVDKSEEIYVDIGYLKALCLLLKNTSNTAVVNYIHWTFVFGSQAYIDLELDNAENRLDKCINNIPFEDGYISEILQSPATQQNKDLVSTIFEKIRNEFITEIQKSWLDVKTKKLVQMKIENLHLQFGIPSEPEMTSDKTIISYDFEVGPHALQNFINFKNAQIQRLAKLILNRGDYINRNKRDIDIDINAYYLPYRNYIRIMTGLLLVPMLNTKAPTALTYGFLGSYLGHEISHSLDAKSSNIEKIQKEGNWISNEVEEGYDEKAKCFKQKFKSSGVDTTATLYENIADSVGIRLSYNALKKNIDHNKNKDEVLPGLENVTGEKLFFVSFASYFCTYPLRDYNYGEIYPTAQVRVNQAVSNLDGFVKTFQCKDNSLLIQNKKCDFWA